MARSGSFEKRGRHPTRFDLLRSFGIGYIGDSARECTRLHMYQDECKTPAARKILLCKSPQKTIWSPFPGIPDRSKGERCIGNICHAVHLRPCTHAEARGPFRRLGFRSLRTDGLGRPGSPHAQRSSSSRISTARKPVAIDLRARASGRESAFKGKAAGVGGNEAVAKLSSERLQVQKAPRSAAALASSHQTSSLASSTTLQQ